MQTSNWTKKTYMNLSTSKWKIQLKEKKNYLKVLTMRASWPYSSEELEVHLSPCNL